jgi:hypothetical protein
MKFINSLEKKIGRFAISNISLYLIICYGFGYLISYINSDFLQYLTLNPYLIITKLQLWRIFSWILVPPNSGNIFFTLVMLYFYYSIGTTLERTWGTFLYNFYLFLGMAFTILGSFLLLGYLYLNVGFYGGRLTDVASELPGIFSLFSTYYINMSIFLAFALTFPDNQVLLMFLIPVKVKWLGVLYGIMILYDFIANGVVYRFVIGASLLNFVVFYLLTKKRYHMSSKQMKRRQTFRREVKVNTQITRHKCAICGRTEQTNPQLEFRFCSKCDGNYEYCSDHLFTHEHIKK